jgi:hypothetical protein
VARRASPHQRNLPKTLTGGTRALPIGGFLFCISSNLPEDRVEFAADAIVSMASREAMKAHVKNGFPTSFRSPRGSQ